MVADLQPAVAVGAERFIHTVEECRGRFLSEPRIPFVEIASLDGPEHTKQYDAVFCMEVLEHVFHWEPALARMARLLAPSGTLVVSVPVEIGVPVIIKQIAGTIAGWRSVGYYPGTTPYSWRDDHKGFNWRVLRDRLTRQFEVTRIVASPFSWLGPGLATQVWLVCRLREDASK